MSSQLNVAQIEEVRLELISPHPNNLRPLDPEDQANKELAESIREQGVLQPAMIATAPDGMVPTPYVIVFGHRRRLAAQMAGLATMPCIVKRGDWSREQIDLAQITENLEREPLPPVVEAMRIQKYMEDHNLGVRQVAQRLKKSPALISKRLAFLKLPGDVQLLVDNGTISKPAAYELTKLHEHADQLREVAFETRGEDAVLVRDAVDRALTEIQAATAEASEAPSEDATPRRAGRPRAEKETAHQAQRRKQVYVPVGVNGTVNPRVTMPKELFDWALRHFGRKKDGEGVVSYRAEMSALLVGALEAKRAQVEAQAEAEQAVAS